MLDQYYTPFKTTTLGQNSKGVFRLHSERFTLINISKAYLIGDIID